MNQWTNAKLCGVGNLILGGILFFSPWLFSFSAGAESRNAIISGIVIVVLDCRTRSIRGLGRMAQSDCRSLVNHLALGIKITGNKAMREDVVIGIGAAVLAAIENWTATQFPTWQASNRLRQSSGRVGRSRRNQSRRPRWIS